MTRTVIAHIADAHLGQRLVLGGDIAGDRMRYEDAHDENEDHLRRVLDDLTRAGISEIVFGGDMGSRSAPVRFLEILDRYGLAPSMVLGNHDAYAEVAHHRSIGLGAIEGKLCSSRDDGRWRRITLDSSDNTIGARQLAWLADEIEGASRVALFVHHPVLKIDTPIDRCGAALTDREDLNALLRSVTCEVVVFCGHYHMIDETCEANIRQFATPAISYQIVKQADRIQVDARTFGYRTVEFDGADIRTKCVVLTDSA